VGSSEGKAEGFNRYGFDGDCVGTDDDIVSDPHPEHVL